MKKNQKVSFILFIFLIISACLASNSFSFHSCVSGQTQGARPYIFEATKYLGNDEVRYVFIQESSHAFYYKLADLGDPFDGGGWSRCAWDVPEDFNFCATDYEGDCLAQLALYDDGFYVNRDIDEDGYSDFDEIAFGGDFTDPNIVPTFVTDTDQDGIVDVIENQIGTNPEVATSFVSGDFSTYSITNYDPESKTYAVVVELQNSSSQYYVMEEFTLTGLAPFGSPDSYTLADYGDLPEGIDISLKEVTVSDGISVYQDVCDLSSEATLSGNTDLWTEISYNLPEYTGDTGILGIGDNVTNSVDNSTSAIASWNTLITLLPNLTLDSSTSADVTIDPVGIAQGVALAVNTVQTSELSEITEVGDDDIEASSDSALEGLDDFGAIDYDEGDVLGKGGMEGAIASLSWVDDLFVIPTIDQQSSFTISGFTFAGVEFPDMAADFDNAFVPMVRTLFLFFFYLSCVWVFFKLTRYGWG